MEGTMRSPRYLLRTTAAMALLLIATLAHGSDVAPRRTLPADVQADVDAMAVRLAEVNDTGSALACSRAVENARHGVETMLEVGEKNLRAGYMTQATYDAMTPALRSLLGVLSVPDCEAAAGPRHDFYQCMSSDYNHVLACGKAHPFEP